MFDQIARRKEREERQESSLERYFSVFFVVLIKRAFCAVALAVTLAGIVVWGNKTGIAKEEGEIINSYNAPEQNDEVPFSNLLDQIRQQDEEQRIVKEILEQEEISMLIWQTILAKGEEWKSLKLEAEVLEDRVSLQLSDEAETVFITVFSRQTDRFPTESTNGSKWDEFEDLWQECEAILHEEGIEDYERFSWHMTDEMHREEETLGKFILYQTAEGKQGFFRQNGEVLYQVETRSSLGKGDPDRGMLQGREPEKGYPFDIQEMKTQIKKLSAIEEEEEQEEWEEPESGLYQSMLWKLWDGRMPAWGVGWNSTVMRDAAYRILYSQDEVPAWEEISDVEVLPVWTGENDRIETCSDLKKFPHLKKLRLYGADQSQVIFDLTKEMLPELEELIVDWIELKNLDFLKVFPQLKVLSISDCGLEDISGIEYQKELRKCFFGENMISDISPLKNCKKMEILTLTYNGIKDISALAALTKLEKINLNNNQIADLSPLKDLTKLTALEASHNQISDISPLEGIHKLDNLALEYNEIQDIHVIENMPLMRHLGLYHNQIKDFSPVLGLTQLLSLSVGENPGQDHIGDLVFVPELVIGSGFSEDEGLQQAAQEILERFYPEEALTAEDMVKGDLNGDGVADLVITGLKEAEDDWHDDGRKIYPFLMQADGSLRTLAPIGTWEPNSGDPYGDPYEGILITDGRLLVKVYGGSGWRWRYTNIYQYENGEMKEKWELEIAYFTGSRGCDFYIINKEEGSDCHYVIAGEWEEESRKLLIERTGEPPSPVETELTKKYSEYQEQIEITLTELHVGVGRPGVSTGFYGYQIHDRFYDTERLPEEVLREAAEMYLSEYQELPVPCYTSEEIFANYKTLTGVELPEILFIGKDKKNPEEVKILAYEGCQQVEDGSFEHELSLWKIGYGAEKPEIWKCEAIIYYDEKDGVFSVG